MPTCPLCNTAISADNAGLLADVIDREVTWSMAESDHVRFGYPVGKTFDIPDVGTAEVVAKKTSYSTGDLGKGYYDDDLPQGTEFETFVVLKVGDNYFKKIGTGDSYGEVTWHGQCRPVQPKEKTVTVYDFN